MPYRDPNTIIGTIGGFLGYILAKFKLLPFFQFDASIFQFDASIWGAAIGAAVSFFTTLLCRYLWELTSKFFNRLYIRWKR